VHETAALPSPGVKVNSPGVTVTVAATPATEADAEYVLYATGSVQNHVDARTKL
jgi:hypothetical protein